MKVYYASAITFPALPVSRLQILNTVEALHQNLGDAFMFGASAVDSENGIYSGPLKNYGYHKSVVLGWLQMQYISINKFDVVYGREYPLMWSIIMLNRFIFHRKIKFVFEAHHLPDDFRLKHILKQASHVFCVSEGLASDLKKKFPFIEVSVLRNGVDLKNNVVQEGKDALRKKFNLPLEAPIVTYIGNIGTHDWKGEDVLFDARPYAKDDHIHYVFAGVRDVDSERIMNAYSSPDTTILGRLNAQEVAELETLSDVLVLPNKPTTVEGERYTSPIKMFSYMRSGVPILASDLPCIREVLNESNSFLVKSDDPKALSDMIRFVLKNPEEALLKAEKAKQDVEQYSWTKKADTIVDYLMKTI